MNIIGFGRHLVKYLRATRAVAAMEYAIIVGIGLAVGLFQDEIVGVITDVTTDLKDTRKDIGTDQVLPTAE